jgi:hypothetical protein
VNDIQTGRGNIDHVLVGPPGVFLLETKNRAGRLAVRRDALVVQCPEDADEAFRDEAVAVRARAAAARLSLALRRAGWRGWVQPVVVLWGTFEQGSVASRGVEWVHGDALRAVLGARPPVLSAAEVGIVAEALHDDGLLSAAASPSPSRRAAAP